MGLNETPSSKRIRISFFGRRNAGKSSLVNALTNQNLSVVSATPGTTTDPVSKSMELGNLGPVVITDTAGIDDVGELGNLRVEKTLEIINKTDIAVLVVDSLEGESEFDKELKKLFENKKLSYIIVYNKCDDCDVNTDVLCVSAKTGRNIEKLKEKIISYIFFPTCFG